jgi:flagellar biosynthesis protein FlhG
VQRKPLLATANNTPDKELLAFKDLAQAVLKAPLNTYEGIRFFADKA